MRSIGFGYREIFLDQQISGKWIDIKVSQLDGHSTFQVRKFSDSAGGYSYRPSQRSILQNRAIYWRTLNETLEVIETSLDYNLYDNQVRFVFADSPIVGQVSIRETEDKVIILVATVATLHRIILTHPKLIAFEEKFSAKCSNTIPSIFNQMSISNKSSMGNIESLNLYDQLINIPIPITADAEVLPNGECVFALSFLNGSVNICKVSGNNVVSQFDLRQANIFTRLWTGFKSLKSTSIDSHSVIALNFFTAKYERSRSVLFLVSLTMNGHLCLWKCNNSSSPLLNDWTLLQDVIVHKKFISESHTDSSMILRKAIAEKYGDLPSYSVFIPNEGFKVYQIVLNPKPTTENASHFLLIELHYIEYQEREVVDYTLTSDFLYHLSRNSDEDTEWDIKSLKISDNLESRFNMALLDPLPYPEIEIYPDTLDPKDFFFDLIFNKSTFSSSTIYQALKMFQSAQSLSKSVVEGDWEQLKHCSMNIIDSEIAYACSSSDSLLTDTEYFEVTLKYWQGFYSSCVEYHMSTIKPLGIFYDVNMQLLFVIKKARISFLRETDFLETMFYFPQCISLPEQSEGGPDESSTQILMLIRFLEIIELIEGTLEESHKRRIEKRLRENSSSLESACEEISNYFVGADPLSENPVNRHFITVLSTKIRELGLNGISAMRLLLLVLSTWDIENLENLSGGGGEELYEREGIPEFLMGSRVGANLTHKTMKQLISHRFLIARNTMVLQAILNSRFFQSNEGEERVHMQISLKERRDAVVSTLFYYGLMKLFERAPEPKIQDSLIDRGLKVANLLGCNTSDHIMHGSSKEFWPVKLVELFLISNVGGLSIRSKVSRSTNLSPILNYAEATGRVLWPNDNEKDRPFEEFLISNCQYSALMAHAIDMGLYFKQTESNLRKFYHGIVELTTGQPERALRYFRAIGLSDLWPEPYFYTKILKANPEQTTPLSLLYYQKVITILQVFDFVPAVQIIADDALLISSEDDSKTTLCALAFKSALYLRDYNEAFKYILKMPSETKDGDGRGEKISSLRTFIGQIIGLGDVETLINLKLDEMFSPFCTIREQVEEILESQASMSNPLSSTGVYQMLYVYHLKQQNFHKAALAMFSRAYRLGEKSSGIEALKAQHNTYLDILNCLSLVENPLFRVVWLQIPTLFLTEEGNTELIECFDGSFVPRIITSDKVEYYSYADILKHLEVISNIIKLNGKIPCESVRIESFRQKADLVYTSLLKEHYFDEALKLSKMWGLPQELLIEAFTSACINLSLEILPLSGDPLDYIRHVDFSDIPIKDSNVIEKAFYLLQKYLNETEGTRSTKMHKLITLKLLSANIPLPQWLIDSYKRRDANELIRCYYRFGDWEEAVGLIVKMFEVTLGRRKKNEFDDSIRLLNAYESEPYLPFDLIDSVIYEVKQEARENPSLLKLSESASTLVGEYEKRFRETRMERAHIFK